MSLVENVKALLESAPQAAAVLDLGPFDDFPQLAGALFRQICTSDAVGNTVQANYASDAHLVETTLYDVSETARRNFEPGGPASALLFSQGVHAIMAHRVAHRLWTDGDHNLALAIKVACGRPLATDIHPAAKVGAGLWLDHGLGVVIGETCVIEDDVSIWHNVTLGSTLNDAGPRRHPHIGAGAVIGAGATLLGGITIGANANIASGSIVVEDIPAGTLAVGTKAQVHGPARVSFRADKGSSS